MSSGPGGPRTAVSHPAHAHLPVRELAQRLGAEAIRAVECCDDYQIASAGFFTADAATPDSIARAQDLDRISQHLRAIASALHGLAGQAASEWRVASTKITEGIGLAEVADRLGGHGRSGLDCALASAGEIELF